LGLSCTLHHGDAPHYERNSGPPGITFLAFLLTARNPLLAFKSHAEWDEKTTPDGVNQEIFCFD
jgi:hypothetical protein